MDVTHHGITRLPAILGFLPQRAGIGPPFWISPLDGLVARPSCGEGAPAAS